MTSRPRFPVGLTIAAAVVFAICVGLGVWQLQRLDWKTHQLARIETLKHAPPVPIGPVLARAARGADVSFTRVTADCQPAPAALATLRMVSDNGDWIARVISVCALGPSTNVMVDRGFLTASRGQPNPAPVSLPAPGIVTGVVFRSGPALTLVAERETPPAPGVAPAPYPDPAGNLQYVGAYAPTWFGLAGAVACVYAAMLWRRSHPKPPARR